MRLPIPSTCALLIAVLAISHVKGIQASFPSSFYGIRLSESTDATNTDKAVPQDNATTDVQTADKAAASQVSETLSAERHDVDELFKDFPFEAPRLPNFPMSPGSVEMAHRFYSDIKKEISAAAQDGEEVMQDKERENTEMLPKAFSFSSRVRTLGALLSGSLLSECKRILVARTIPTIVLYAIFWIRNHKLPSQGGAEVNFSIDFFRFLLINSQVHFTIGRYFLFELMAYLLRPFPFLQYKNGSVYAEPTFMGIDVSNLLFVTLSCMIKAKLLTKFSEKQLGRLYLMHLLLSFLGVPVLRHILMIVHIALPVLMISSDIKTSKCSLLLLPIGVMTAWCQYYNDGFALYEAPDWIVKPFNKQLLPSVSQTISDVGVDFAFRHSLVQVVSVGFVSLVAILLYITAGSFLKMKIEFGHCVLFELLRLACFVLNDIFKYIVQRSAKFYLFPNLSFFVDTNLYFTVCSIPFYVPTLCFLVLSSMFKVMATYSNDEKRPNYLDFIYSPIDSQALKLPIYIEEDKITISRMLVTFLVLQMFNSTVAAILYPISFVYMCYFYNQETKVKDKFYAILSVLSTLPTAYCFYRGKGMIPWTHILREKANLPVTLFELRNVYHKKILDFAAAKQKFLDRLPASPKSNSGQGHNNDAKKLKNESQEVHDTETIDAAEPSAPSAESEQRNETSSEDAMSNPMIGGTNGKSSDTASESSQGTEEKSSAHPCSILTAVILSIGTILLL
jgi:hypothetical protein